MHEEMNNLDSFFHKQLIRRHLLGLYMLIIVSLCIVTYFSWMLGILFILITIIVFYDHRKKENALRKRQIQFLTNISYQVENAGKDVFLQMPIGIIIYNEDFEIEWANSYIYELNDSESLLGKSLSHFSDDFMPYINSDEVEMSVNINASDFKVSVNRENRTLYLLNQTEEVKLERQIHNEQIVVANIYLDNYEEVLGNLADNIRGKINASVNEKLNKWAAKNELLLKRVAQDRYLAIFTKQILERLETNKFNILDELRELHVDEIKRNPITLSIGIGVGSRNIPELAKFAQSALDVALGRGGDQVAIREKEEQVRFYGGKTNPKEKRTRVRARVVSHALRELVKESENVIIMGHKAPDMDSLGAAIGVLNIAQSNEVDGYIIFDEADVTTGVSRVMDMIKKDESSWCHFITPAEAEALYHPNSLIVVVDTHQPSFVSNEKLLMNAQYKVVIDHHRRGVEFIDDPTLVYMEPYASSTSELVTELIEYQPNRKKLSTLEATVLLAGIIVDTKSFALRTGARTFDAASYLRLKGADPVLVQQLLKDDLDTYIARNKLIERCSMYHDELAIAVADDETTYSHITLAQTADTLLTINEVTASFVIGRVDEETIFISARSLGNVNVQLLMEQLNGGGHLTNAATQIESVSTKEAEEKLREVIDEYYEEDE